MAPAVEDETGCFGQGKKKRAEFPALALHCQGYNLTLRAGNWEAATPYSVLRTVCTCLSGRNIE